MPKLRSELSRLYNYEIGLGNESRIDEWCQDGWFGYLRVDNRIGRKVAVVGEHLS